MPQHGRKLVNDWPVQKFWSENWIARNTKTWPPSIKFEGFQQLKFFEEVRWLNLIQIFKSQTLETLTLKFQLGRGIDYEGARDEGVIVDWAMKATGPAVTGTKKTKNELINKYKTNPAFIYNGNIKADTDLWKKYQLIAEIHVPLVPFLRNKVIYQNLNFHQLYQ